VSLKIRGHKGGGKVWAKVSLSEQRKMLKGAPSDASLLLLLFVGMSEGDGCGDVSSTKAVYAEVV
jgi:hypothetical protein